MANDPKAEANPVLTGVQLIPSSHNPTYPVDWRWERAKWLRQNNARTTKTDDTWVRMTREFQRRLDNASKHSDYVRLCDRFPGVYWAWHWWQIPESLHDMTRYGIEAYLISGATYQYAAQRLGVHEATVAAYEKLFFNIRGRLNKTAFVVNRVLGRSVQHGLSERNYDLLWKLYGYVKGPLFLDSVMLKCLSLDRVTDASQVGDAIGHMYRSSINAKALNAVMTITTGGKEALIMEQYSRLLEIEKSGAVGAVGTIQQNIQMMISDLGFSKVPPSLDASGRSNYAGDRPYELRNAERLQQIATGRPPDGLDAWDGFELPPPPVDKVPLPIELAGSFSQPAAGSGESELPPHTYGALNGHGSTLNGSGH